MKGHELKFDSAVASPLGPGDFLTYSVVRPILRRLQNEIAVSGEPSTKTGEDMPYQDVSDTDPSEVAFISLLPGLQVDNAVSARCHKIFCIANDSSRSMLATTMELNVTLMSLSMLFQIFSKLTCNIASLSQIVAKHTSAISNW